MKVRELEVQLPFSSMCNNHQPTCELMKILKRDYAMPFFVNNNFST